MAKNPLGIKRFGPATFYVRDAESQSRRMAELLGIQVTHVPSGEDPIFGLKGEDTCLILDSSAEARGLAEKHGNHVREIGIYVENLERALKHVGDHSSAEITRCPVDGAGLVKAPHDGEVYFRLVEEGGQVYRGIKRDESVDPEGGEHAFQRIDHVVTNTQKIKPVVQFFKEAFGLEKVNEFTIKVETEAFSASLFSEVMGIVGTQNEVLFPVNEPLPDDPDSQIPAQLREVGRSHVQHIALATDDIISSISVLREHGLGFLEFRNKEHAERYYKEVPERLGDITVPEAMDTLRNLGILVDKCGEGYLLQLFSKRLFPEHSVPFVEIVQRASDVVGCFGDGNFAALAESLEFAMRKRAEEAAKD